MLPNLVGIRLFMFAATADTSEIIHLEERQLVGLQMPAAWTAAGLAFEVSADGVAFVPLYWNGSLYEIDAAGGAVVDAGVSLEPDATTAWPYARLVSGTHAVPVAQVAARSVVAFTRNP